MGTLPSSLPSLTLRLPLAPLPSFIDNLIDWKRVEERYVAATSQ